MIMNKFIVFKVFKLGIDKLPTKVCTNIKKYMKLKY